MPCARSVGSAANVPLVKIARVTSVTDFADRGWCWMTGVSTCSVGVKDRWTSSPGFCCQRSLDQFRRPGKDAPMGQNASALSATPIANARPRSYFDFRSGDFASQIARVFVVKDRWTSSVVWTGELRNGGATLREPDAIRLVFLCCAHGHQPQYTLRWKAYDVLG